MQWHGGRYYTFYFAKFGGQTLFYGNVICEQLKFGCYWPNIKIFWIRSLQHLNRLFCVCEWAWVCCSLGARVWLLIYDVFCLLCGFFRCRSEEEDPYGLYRSPAGLTHLPFVSGLLCVYVVCCSVAGCDIFPSEWNQILTVFQCTVDHHQEDIILLIESRFWCSPPPTCSTRPLILQWRISSGPVATMFSVFWMYLIVLFASMYSFSIFLVVDRYSGPVSYRQVSLTGQNLHKSTGFVYRWK